MADEPDGPEELAPYRIETARSSRSRCRTCRRKIDKGKLRIGVLLEGPYGTGYLWHHLACAARRRFEDVEAAYAEGASVEEGLEPPPLDELRELREEAERKKEERRAIPHAERAPSGRSKCKRCGETIAKGDFRVILLREVAFGRQVRSGPVHVHPECVAAELREPHCPTEAEGFYGALRENSPEVSGEGLDALLARIGEVVP